MKTDAIFRPLVNRPPDRERYRSRFRSRWLQTLHALDRELQHLGVRRAVIQIDCDESQIRQDGWPRSDARVRGPAVALSFECDRGHLTYPCDTYNNWQDNIRAIALGLEALRAVDRYGITSNGEQYRGWKALTFRDAEFTTAEKAAEFLSRLEKVPAGKSDILASAVVAQRAYTAATTNYHPDRGGDPQGFQKILAARDTLRRHHDGQGNHKG